MKNQISNNESKVVRYIILEDEVAYDRDDYDVWGAVLYDMANNEITTSKYGHGTDMAERSESIKVEKAIEQGLVNVEGLLKVLVNALPISVTDLLYDYSATYSLDKPLGIPCKVARGRKFKGEGYLIYSQAEDVRYGLGAYRGEKSYYPVILNPEDGSLNKINSYGYIEFPDWLDGNAKEVAYNNIEKTLHQVYRLAHAWAYKMSYSSCDTTIYRNLVKSVARLAIPTDVPEVVTKAIEAEKARIAAAKEAKMQEKLPGIIEWVKKNTDKTTEEDILALAKHIYHKYNG